jgi:hypothetical protein
MATALGWVTRVASSPVLDRFGWRHRAERAAYRATRVGFTAATAASRAFVTARGVAGTVRSPAARTGALFDLTPTDDQRMLVEVVREFAAERLRPAASDADRDAAPPQGLSAAAAELGLWQVAVPEQLGGIAERRSAVTGVLVAEALAQGDLGLAVACLAPAAVGTALGLWGMPTSRPPTCPRSSATVRRKRRWRSPSRTRCSTRSHCAPAPSARRGGTGWTA